MENSNYENMPNELKQKYLHIISKSQNWFDINTLEDLENYEEIRKNICVAILNDDMENIPEKFKQMSKKDRIIFARLQLDFGLDIDEATNLVNKYGIGLNESQKHRCCDFLKLEEKCDKYIKENNFSKVKS